MVVRVFSDLVKAKVSDPDLIVVVVLKRCGFKLSSILSMFIKVMFPFLLSLSLKMLVIDLTKVSIVLLGSSLLLAKFLKSWSTASL